MTTPLRFPNVYINASVCKLTRGRNKRSNTLFAYSKEHARMGIVEMQVRSGNSRGHKHWPLTKTKNKTLKKAKTNSNELASVTTRQAETEGREKRKKVEGRSGWEIEQKESDSGKNILKCKSGAFPSALSPVLSFFPALIICVLHFLPLFFIISLPVFPSSFLHLSLLLLLRLHLVQ